MASQIVTLTINPALDVNTAALQVVPEQKVRCVEPRYEPGGGGVNVSRAIKHLGGESLAFYPAGGATGQAFQKLLSEENIDHIPYQIDGWTRENLIVFEETSLLQYRFVMPGPTLQETDWTGYLDKLVPLMITADYVVASGSLAPGVPAEFYARLAEVASKSRCRLMVDTSGAALQVAMEAGAYLLKPNRRELQLLVGQSLMEESQLLDGVCELIQRNPVQAMVVSLGDQGALLATKERFDYLRVPAVPIASKVGAGDSMVAGIALGLSRGLQLIDAVRLGVAAGTAAVMTPSTQLCRKEDTERLHDQVVIQPGEIWEER